jgi:tRNA pseudouridine32 synthase/23S rRNA pseudouridine746 synthase
MVGTVSPMILKEVPFGWVVHKPAHWISVRGHGSHPVVGDWLEKEVGARVWPVHRLDLETSGLLLFARDSDQHRRLSVQFERHRVKKEYRALAWGKLPRPVLKVESPIAGKRCLTQFEKIQEVPLGESAITYLKAFPLTGRRHQIRIHAAGLHAPLLGDPKYGGPISPAVPRVALHAYRLRLESGEEFEAPFPMDFSNWLTVLFEEGAPEKLGMCEAAPR